MSDPLPKIWRVQTKSKVLDRCSLASDGSVYRYWDAAALGQNPSEIKTAIKQQLFENGLVLEECQSKSLIQILYGQYP